MGISGLQKFMEKNAEGLFEQVNLLEIADSYRNETKRDPVMLVDISSCVTHFSNSDVDTVILLGDLKKFEEYIYNFINKCFHLGIKLKVVFDGMKPEFKRRAWPEKTKRNVLELKKLYSGEPCMWGNFDIGLRLGIATQVFLSTDKCEYWRSLYEADIDIIRFTKESDCFAILSGDSDFIVAADARYHLSPRDFNLEFMTAYNYNRNKLAEFLNIFPSQLPVFSSLCHNPSIDSELLNKFYIRNKINPKRRFVEVAKFIKDFPLKEEILEHYLNTTRINGLNKNMVLMLTQRLKYLSGYNIEKGLEFTGFTTWDEIVLLAEKKFTKAEAHKCILEIITQKKFFCSVNWSNVFNYLPASSLRSFRKKIYGILFFEYPYSNVRVTEYTFECFRKGNPAEFNVTEVSFVRRFHPGLSYLWSPDTSSEAKKQRLKAFCGVINEKLKLDYLISKKIPEELVFPLLITFYLIWSVDVKIKPFEMKTILIQAILVHRLTSKEIESYPKDVHLGALELSEWFYDILNHFYILNSVCGNPYSNQKTKITNFFDGKVFHYVWAKLKEANNDTKIWRREVNAQFKILKRKLYYLGFKCYGKAHNWTKV